MRDNGKDCVVFMERKYLVHCGHGKQLSRYLVRLILEDFPFATTATRHIPRRASASSMAVDTHEARGFDKENTTSENTNARKRYGSDCVN